MSLTSELYLPSLIPFSLEKQYEILYKKTKDESFICADTFSSIN